MPKRLDSIKPGIVNRQTLSFSDPEMEKAFLSETWKQAVDLIRSYFPVAMFLASFGFGGLMVLFPRIMWLRYLTIGLVVLFLAAYTLLRYRPPGKRAIRYVYAPLLGVLPGWGFAYITVLFPQSNMESLAFLFVALHMLTISLLAPIVFIDAVVILNAIFYGFVGIVFLASDMLLTQAVIQSLFLLAIDAICMFVSHDRESRLRLTFYQRGVIEERERELSREKEKSESLLLNVLPRAVADRLKNGEENVADGFDEATILFCDIVDFTPLSERITPLESVELLNTVFSTFDDIAALHGLETIKIAGDAYMAAGGLPEYKKDHVQAVAEMALDMQKAAKGFISASGESVRLRIGIHTGPVVAGVVGKRKFTYDLWGDAVNTAARMESHGVAGAIQVTKKTRDLLKNTYELEPRQTIEVKGKGPMEVFLLKGKLPYEKKLP